MKFQTFGKIEYDVYARQCGLCPENEYSDIYNTTSLIKALLKFVIFKYKYPQVILTLGNRYIDCCDCYFRESCKNKQID